MGLRIALVLLLIPAAAASSGGDAFSNGVFASITPLLALFGQDFANHFLSQSTSWLDSVIFATGPLGIPAAITAAIRVSGYSFLKGLIGRGGERQSTIEKDLLSSTSKDVCELWDGQKVVRLEATDPLIQELIYVSKDSTDDEEGKNRKDGIGSEEDGNGKVGTDGEEWYNLREAISAEVLVKQGRGIGDVDTDVENQKQSEPEPETEDHQEPPNILLNLIGDSRSWELRAGAILGILLQTTVLIVAGLTTFDPYMKHQFPVLLYEFCFMAGGTALLTFGLIICALMVDRRTQEETYKTKEGEPPVLVLWLQRGRSDSDRSFAPFIFGVHRSCIRTSRLPANGPSESLKLWTLVGTLAATLGFIIQFIGLSGMHWPTQVTQFTITLIMTAVRAFIRRAPQPPEIYQSIEDEPNTISDKHEMDWLASKPKNMSFMDLKNSIEPWQLMTAASLIDVHDEENNNKEIEAQQFVLNRRCRLGTLCGWTGMERKWAISLATAIDGVMNILKTDLDLELEPKNVFQWELKLKTGKTTQKISFKITRDERTNLWESNFTQLEAALSLGLFGDKFLEHRLPKEDSTALKGKELDNLKDDWLRLDEKMEKKPMSIRLLGPWTPGALRDLKWWVGPQKRKLMEVVLPKNGGNLVNVEQYPPRRIGALITDPEPIKEAKFKQRYRIAGFGGIVVESELGQSVDPSQQRYLAAISEADLGLLYAQHIFSTFMQAIAKNKIREFSKATIENKWKFVPDQEDSWNSIQLSEKTIEKLALCVQRAGLGDIEDSYLSIITPLSNEGKLPSSEQVLEAARETAIQAQSQQRWEQAYQVYRLLLSTMSGKSDEMAVKATALFAEFFRTLHKELQKVTDKDDYMSSYSRGMAQNIYERMKEDLKIAHGGVLHYFTKIYSIQGWSEVGADLELSRQGDIHGPKAIQRFLNQNKLHAEVAMESRPHFKVKLLRWRIELWSAKDFFDRTALHYEAMRADFSEVLDSGMTWSPSLFDSEDDPDSPDCYGMTILHAAAETGNDKIIEVVVQKGANKERKFQNRTALHIAAGCGRVKAVRKLILLGADIGVETFGGKKALHLAVLGGHWEVVMELWGKEGADAADEFGKQALHLAAAAGNRAVVRNMGENSAGNRTMVELLLERITDPTGINVKDAAEWTALHWAARNGHAEIVNALLGKSADVHAKDNIKRTALHYAAGEGHTDVVRILLDKAAENHGGSHLYEGNGADEDARANIVGERMGIINEKDAGGNTALHIAVRLSRAGVVRILIQRKAVFMADEEGASVLSSLNLLQDRARTVVVCILHQLLGTNKVTVKVINTKIEMARRWIERNFSCHEQMLRIIVELAVKREMQPEGAPKAEALKLWEDASCALLYAIFVKNGASAKDTDRSEMTELEPTHSAGVLDRVDRIKEALIEEGARLLKEEPI